MSGAIVRQDFGVREDPVICTFALMEKTTLDSLLAALDAVKPGGYLTVVPDSGDDLGIGATSSVELIFDDIETEYVSGDRWSVVLSMRKVA